MILALIISVSSFKILKSNQKPIQETSKSVVIQNSNFQSRQFINNNDQNKGNKFSNALVSNSKFNFKGSKNTLLFLNIVNFNNNTIQLDEDFESSPVEIGSGKSTIYNLTLHNLQYKDNSIGIFSFDSSDIELIKLNCKGTLKSTLFKGTITGFSLKDSVIQKFQKDNDHDIRSAIFLSHLKCENSDVEITFHNNTFTENKIPVFELDSEIEYGVKISESFFTYNQASSGSCILISCLPTSRNAKKITIHNNTFSQNENSGNTGIIAGALKINTVQATFSGDNYFYKNDVVYNGPESSDECGAFGASIYIQQARRDPYTLEGLHFEEDATSQSGGSIFIYGNDASSINRGNDVTVSKCTFYKCKSDQFGGAISTGIVNNKGDVTGNNDIIISYCVFTDCEAGSGGAIYVPLGTRRGDESTTVEYCEFINCNGYDGSAIYCASHEFSFEHSNFRSINKEPSPGKSVISIFLKDIPNTPLAAKSIINNCTFTGCEHTILNTDEQSNTANKVTFEQCNFETNTIASDKKNNQGLFDYASIKSLSLDFESCNFTSNTGYCILGESRITVSSFTNCIFKENSCSKGSIFYVTRNPSVEDKEYITITDCQFIDSTITASSGRVNAALHIPLSYVSFEGTNKFSGNKATFDGSSVSKQNCAFGGSIFFECSSNTDVTFSNINIDNSFASNYGGAIGLYCDTSSQIKLSLSFENCAFLQCESEIGGAVYLDENDKVQYEISINRCTFEQCTSPSGSSIHGQIYKFELAHSVFDSLNGEKENNDDFKPSLLYINLKSEGAATTVNNCTFKNDNQYIQFISSSSKPTSGSSTTFTKCTFTNNCRSGSAWGLLQLEYIQSETINIEGCTFDKNGGRCIIQESDTISNVNVKNCIFSNNNGTAGCAICVTTASTSHKMIVEGCQFNNNSPTIPLIGYHGAVVAASNSINFVGKNTFDHNSLTNDQSLNCEEKLMTFGASLVITQNDPEEYTISNLIFKNSQTKHHAGAIGILAGDYDSSDPSKKNLFVRIENCQFTDCTSGLKGGAIKCGVLVDDERHYDNDVIIYNCKFTHCSSGLGGALYFQDGDEIGDEETVIQYCTFDNCDSVSEHGSALYCQSYKFDLSHSIFKNMKVSNYYKPKSLIYVNLNENGLQPKVTNCTFNDNSQYIEFASGKDTNVPGSSITFYQCKFYSNYVDAPSIGRYSLTTSMFYLQFIKSSLINIEGCVFDKNGGICIYQYSAGIYNTHIKNCTFSNHQGTDGGYAIRSEDRSSSNNFLIIEDCSFKYNRGYYPNDINLMSVVKYGCVFLSTKNVEFRGSNEFIGNRLESDAPSIGMEFTSPNGASLVIQQFSYQSEFLLENTTFRDSYSQEYGGALSILSNDYTGGEQQSSSIFVTVKNCSFSNCSSATNGGAIRCGLNAGRNEFSNDVKFINCKFNQCKSKEGGALYTMDGTPKGDEETVIQDCTFDGCDATNSGSAIYSKSYKFELSNSIFENMKGQDRSLIYVHMDEEGLNPNIVNCSFNHNEQRIQFTSGKLSSPTSSIVFKQCNFTKNFEKPSYDWYSLLNLEHIQSGQVTFDECIFDGNGGRCILQESASICNTLLRKCQFINNDGYAGCAIFSTTRSEDNRLITVENCIFKDNKATNNDQTYRGGCIYAKSGSIEFRGVNEFVGNYVYTTDKVTDELYMTMGSSLLIDQDTVEEFTLSNLIFRDCYSQHMAGALCILAGDFFGEESKDHIFIHIDNCTFTNCTSGQKGGAIKCGISSKELFADLNNDVNITNCQFIQCKSAEGGALYFQDGNEVGDEETVIQNCIFNGCDATKSGSAIYCRSYKFELSHTTFENMTGQCPSFLYINLDEEGLSPKVTNCIFKHNKQRIEFISGKSTHNSGSSIMFTKCTFTKNFETYNENSCTTLELKYIQAGNVTFDECTFDENGGRCISQDTYTICSTYIHKCHFVNNYGYDGSAIFTATRSDDARLITVEDCLFKNNTATQTLSFNCGAVCAYSGSIEFRGVNEFIGNYIHSSDEVSDEMEMTIGSSLFIMQEGPEEYTVSNLIFRDCFSEHMGGALAIFAGDYYPDEDESNPKNHLFIHIDNCTFTNCSAGLKGGAIKCGLTSSCTDQDFSNDVNITNCQFTKCHATEGGALYFRDGNDVGDEETVVQHCTFDGCYGIAGTAIYCRSYKFDLSDTVFRNSPETQEGNEDYESVSFLFVIHDEIDIKSNISNCTFFNNEQYIIFYSSTPSLGEDQANNILFYDCKFNKNNQRSNGADTILDLTNILATNVIFEKCLFEENGGRCISQEGEITSNTKITNCVFNNNHGGTGCVIYALESVVTDQPYITIEDCIFSNNKAAFYTQARAPICVDTLSTVFVGVNQFINNELRENDEDTETSSSNGGSLLINQREPAEYKLSNLVFTNSYSDTNGGALAVFAGDLEGKGEATTLFITIENCTFTNCSSAKQGGAIQCGTQSFSDDYTRDNDVKISYCTFTNCKSLQGGALYFMDGDADGDEETVIEYCTFDGCIGSTGSAIFCRSYKFLMSHSIIQNSKETGSTSELSDTESVLFIYLNEAGIQPVVKNCTFYNNEQNIEFQSHGPVAGEGGPKSTISFTECNFTHNNHDDSVGISSMLDLQYIQSAQITFDSCLFEDNSGRCIMQESEVTCATHIKNCVFNANHGGTGCVIYAIENDFTKTPYITIEDCTFSNNRVSFGFQAKAPVCVDTLSAVFAGVNTFINNEVRENDEDTESSSSNGGSLLINQHEPAEYKLSNLVFTNSYSDGNGGGLTVFAGDLEGKGEPKTLFITIENCTFTNCSSAKQGGAIQCGTQSYSDDYTRDNDVNISYCTFTNCKSLQGGALYFMDGDADGDEETVIEYCTFDGCIGSTGSAIFCRSYKFLMSHSKLQNSKPYGSKTELSETESVLFVYLNEAGIQPVVTNCTFFNNEQNIEFQSHGPIAGDGPSSTINFTECNFYQNNQESNGADSIVDLQYIQSMLITFYKCLFEDNAGQCIKQESETVCNTHIKECIFNANHGGSGCAIYSASTLEGTKEPLMTIESCTFSNNKITSTYGPRGCVYGTTITLKFTGQNQFINNQVIYESYDRQARAAGPGFSQGACGAALYLIQDNDVEFELKDAVFSRCESTNYGGAVAIACFEDENLIKKMLVKIVGCTFTDCSSAYGGAICSTIEGTITIDKCRFFNGKATEGGDIYVVDDTTDTPSVFKVTECVFSSSQATDNGGAIYCKSGSVTLTGSNFTKCQSGSKGAAMYVSANSDASFGYNYVEMDKKNGVSAIYYTSSNNQATLRLEGGCYSASKNGQDSTADILVFESVGKIEFKNKPCFAGSKEESIQIIGNQAVNLPDEYFNCKECDAIVVPPSPSITAPTLPPSHPPSHQPTSSSSGASSSSGESLFLPSEDINGTEPDDGANDNKKKSKLSTGAIIGIIIAVLVVIAVIIVVVLLVMRNRTNKNDIRSEQISQDADNSAYALESRITANEDDDQPIWAANSIDQNANQNVDPFMKDFEESVI